MTPTVIALLCALAASLGVGGTLGVQALLAEPEVAPVVEAVVAPQVAEQETRQAVASAGYLDVLVAASVEPEAKPEVRALTAYALCVAGSQAQDQGAAAYGCGERGTALDVLLGVVVETRPTTARPR